MVAAVPAVVVVPAAVGEVRCDSAQPAPPSSIAVAAATPSQVRAGRRPGTEVRSVTALSWPEAATSSRALRSRAMTVSSVSMSFIGRSPA